MSRYTLVETDLVVSIGMDFTAQIWCSDYRGEPLPLEYPARMTVRDKMGSILFETESDPITLAEDPFLILSPENGVMQIVLPRQLTAAWFPSTHSWDAWATIIDPDAGGTFPLGQQIPIAAGRFIIRQRVTHLEDI